MNVIVDTSVWSLVLRRRQVDEADPHVVLFRQRLEAGDGFYLLGNILQELLDGVDSPRDFQKLVTLLRPFPLVEITREIFILASEMRNSFRRRGIQASPVDFLISATCIERGYPLLTSDRDFSRIAAHSKLKLLKPKN